MRNGFSLVELSIVLVILGLLAGGILAGQSLIKAAELRRMVTDMNRYTTAIYSFRDKYFALPGDMNNATSFWGDNNTLCADAAITNGTPGTCNGNGNGLVNQLSPSIYNYSEAYQAWVQLAYAGLIEGQYTGNRVAAGVFTIGPGQSAPQTARRNMLWLSTGDAGGCRTALYASDTSYNALYLIGTGLTPPTGPNTDCPNGPSLNAEDAYNVDVKTDDGKASTGNFLARTWWNGTAGTCVAADTTGTNQVAYGATDYVLNNNTVSCLAAWRMR